MRRKPLVIEHVTRPRALVGLEPGTTVLRPPRDSDAVEVSGALRVRVEGLRAAGLRVYVRREGRDLVLALEPVEPER